MNCALQTDAFASTLRCGAEVFRAVCLLTPFASEPFSWHIQIPLVGQAVLDLVDAVVPPLLPLAVGVFVVVGVLAVLPRAIFDCMPLYYSDAMESRLGLSCTKICILVWVV